MGARVQSFLTVWEERGAFPFIVSVLREGYNLEFKKEPPLTRTPDVVSHYQDPAKQVILKEEIRVSSAEERIGGGLGHHQSRLLLKDVFSGEENWQVVPHYQFECSEHLTQVSNIQDGVCGFHLGCPSLRVVDFLNRYEGSLTACVHSSRRLMQVFFKNQVYLFKTQPFGLPRHLVCFQSWSPR